MTARWLLVATIVVSSACSGRETGWRNDGQVPESAIAAFVRQMPLAHRADARRPARDLLEFMVRGVGTHRIHERIEREYEMSVGFLLNDLEEVPRELRYGHLRLQVYREALSVIGDRAEELAFRMIALDHPELPAALGPQDMELLDFRDAPAIDRAEIERRVTALEVELADVLARYGDAVTPYVECTQHKADGLKALRALLMNARGDLRTTTGPIYWMLRRVAPDFPTGPAIRWDDGQPYGWPSCPPPP